MKPPERWTSTADEAMRKRVERHGRVCAASHAFLGRSGRRRPRARSAAMTPLEQAWRDAVTGCQRRKHAMPIAGARQDRGSVMSGARPVRCRRRSPPSGSSPHRRCSSTLRRFHRVSLPLLRDGGYPALYQECGPVPAARSASSSVHHGVVGVLDPSAVYNTGGAHPVLAMGGDPCRIHRGDERHPVYQRGASTRRRMPSPAAAGLRRRRIVGLDLQGA